MTGCKTTRRNFTRSVARSLPIAGALALSGISGRLSAQTSDERPWRLTARPGAAPATPAAAGLHPMALRKERDALLYIPESASKFEKAPLVVSLHGATRNADRGIEFFRTLADELGFLLLAPASEDSTWDAITAGWG